MCIITSTIIVTNIPQVIASMQPVHDILFCNVALSSLQYTVLNNLSLVSPKHAAVTIITKCFNHTSV